MSAPSTSADQPDFVRRQYAFAAHIRDPGINPAPDDVDDRRMQIYRELFFNNVRDFLSNSFPVLRQLYGDDGWTGIMRDYFARHRAHTPLFLQMPREFLGYLEDERGEHCDDPPFLRELAHYEWVELALSVDTREIDDVDANAEGDLLDGVPVLSHLAWPLAYRFPVHAIGPDYLPDEPPEQPTYLVVYRDRADEIGFMELNPVTARLLDMLSAEHPPTGREALEAIAGDLSHPEPRVVVDGGLTIMRELRHRDIILGVRQ